MTEKLPKVTEIVPLELNSYYQYPDIESLDTLGINDERLCNSSSAFKIYIGYKGIIYNFIIESTPFNSYFGNVCYEWHIRGSFYKKANCTIDESFKTTTLSCAFPVEVIRFFVSTSSLTDLECYT